MIAAGLVAFAFTWMYADVVRGLAVQWASSPDASYGFVLAAVALGVAWQRRRAFIAAINPASPPLAPLLVLSAGILLNVVGQLGADIFLTRVSAVVVVAGAVWFLAGRAAFRVVAAPLVFLLIAIPLPELVVNTITLPLQLVASRIAETTLMAASVPVFRDGNVLMLPSTTLEVAQACSGLRSLISLAAVAALLGWITEPTWPRRAALIASAVPIAIAMNGLRVAATGLACEAWGRRAASGSWHEATGWITFVASLALIAGVQRMMGAFRFKADAPAMAPSV
jgi:exosortase